MKMDLNLEGGESERKSVRDDLKKRLSQQHGGDSGDESYFSQLC